MKMIKNISLLALLLIAMVGCIEKTPDYKNFPSADVDFTYGVLGEDYVNDFYVVSTIEFKNTSSKQGNVAWDFGDGTTSTEQNPIHKYEKAGNYKVTLTVEGVGSRTYPILIYDITPILSVTNQSEDIVVINDVTVELGIELPNPDNLKCKYIWSFPAGTMKEDGTTITTFEGFSHEDGTIDYPGKLKFKNVGSQKIEIVTYFDIEGENRRLPDSYVNVQVGFNKPCKTLYFAVYGGNIMAYKLPDPADVPSDCKIYPFDMGVSSGNTPQNILFTNVEEPNDEGQMVKKGYLYILDCGKQYTYINDEDGINGDGKISVMSADGVYSNVVVTNVGQTAFNDPFVGCIANGLIYYTDRNTGIRTIPVTARGEVEANNYFCQNNWLAYYGQGIAYGAIHTALAVDSRGVFWWAKKYNGQGIYRFKSTDIFPDGKPVGGIPYPIIVSGANPKAVALDEARKTMYVYQCTGDKKGFCVYALPSDSEGPRDTDTLVNIPLSASADNATADEGLFVTQFAIDSTTGNVYFGYRTDDDKTYTTGLKYYNPTTKKIESLYGNTMKILGVAINDTPTKLF